MRKILKNLHIARGMEVVKGSIGIDGDRIVYVGEIPSDFEVSVPAEQVYDYGFRHFAFPGLVNNHTHLSMVILRNYADGLPLMEWLNDKVWPIEAEMTPLDIYYGALVAMAELIRCGCTTFRDMYFFMDKVAEATLRSGMRGAIGQGMVLFEKKDLEKFEISRELYEKYGTYERLRIDVAPHAPYTCTDEGLRRSKALADELGLFLHIHLSESDDEVKSSVENYGVRPTQRMADLGVLSERTVAAHCVKMSDEDLHLLKTFSTSVLLNPSSNLKLGNGVARAKDMFDLGINLTIGTDGACSNNNLDMMEEMHLAALLYGLPPAEILKMATVNGAKTCGFSELGVIEVGYLADLAILDLDVANLTPHGNLMSALVYSANSANVRDTMIAGEFVMKDRMILTFDESEAKEMCREVVARLTGEHKLGSSL